MTDFHGDEVIFFFFLKNKIQNGQLKKTEFFKTANSEYFFQKFHGLVLGFIELIDAKDIDVAHPEAVRHKLKNGLNTQKMHFWPVFELMSDSVMAI